MSVRVEAPQELLLEREKPADKDGSSSSRSSAAEGPERDGQAYGSVG